MRMVTHAQVAAALEALERVNPRVVVGGNAATPSSLVELIDATLPTATLFVLNARGTWPTRPGITLETPFIGPGFRRHDNLTYLPVRLSLVPRLFSTTRPPDVVCIQTSPPRDGVVSLGIEVNILPAAIEQVRARGGLVVAEFNPQMPHTKGDALIDVECIDLAVSVDRPLEAISCGTPDERAGAIGANVAHHVGNGATVQLGIGQLPDAAASSLHDRRGLKVWTELASDGIMALDHAGALDRSAPITASFLFGSEELYQWIAATERLEVRRTEVVNDPGRIAGIDGFCSINTALEVDLHAQANAMFVRGSIYSGFGGQPDFVIGALHSRGGHAIIALRSFFEPTATSCIVEALHSPVCSFQHSAIVTEHGSAELVGRSDHAQALELITKAADPRARDALLDAAHDQFGSNLSD